MRYFMFFLSLWLITGCTVPEMTRQAFRTATPTDLTTVYAAGDSTFRDVRLQTFRQGRDMPYEMPTFRNLDEWLQRAAQLRQRILVTTGLWPMPEKTPLNAQVYDWIDHPDYRVAKVYFESYPGFFVTGNLYRPNGKPGPFPGIITPHGHWKEGRLENTETGSIPGRCINLARQGHVVFSYDMVGYRDSKQVSHKFADSKEHEFWGVSLMGLQLWNSIRALDFITSLTDVDTSRIGCTGASGGGTQTFMVAAVDPRIKVAAPVNMISAHFQGGCLCENVAGLRHETFNVEIGALAAPRPLLMVAATGDWTRNTPTVEFPMMQSIYRLFGAEDKVHYEQFDFPHNYNRASREAVYAWFGKWFSGETDRDKLREMPFQVEAPENLLNFPNDEPPPGDMNEARLTDYLKTQARQQFHACLSPEQTHKLTTVYGPALRLVLAAEIPQALDVRYIGEAAGEDFKVTRLLLSNIGANHWIPLVFYQPFKPTTGAVLVVHPDGKTALVQDGTGQPGSLVRALLRKKVSVLAIDLFKTGEHILPAGMKPRDEASIAHFTTFNKTDSQERIQDMVTALAFLHKNYKVGIVALKEAGVWGALAASQVPSLETVLLDGMKQNWDDDAWLIETSYIPHLARYGKLSSALALSTAKNLVLFGASGLDLASVNAARESLKQKPIVISPDFGVEELVDKYY